MPQIPRWPLTLIRTFFCPPELYEEICGDLEQRFERDVPVIGHQRAQWRLIRNTHPCSDWR